MLHATWLHLPGAVAKFNYSCAINRLTYINIYIAEMQSVANGFMGRSPSVRGAPVGGGRGLSVGVSLHMQTVFRRESGSLVIQRNGAAAAIISFAFAFVAVYGPLK